VLVNGKPIPFDMKIGDAGEAFFVFETDEDVPQDLLTSPILGPSKVNTASTIASSAYSWNLLLCERGAMKRWSEIPADSELIGTKSSN
jgi:phosphatidate phosphatase PAH1